MPDDLISGYQWLAALDENTCLDCLILDGKTVRKNCAKKHAKCRCTVIPIIRTWAELGISLPEIPSGTRASSIGPVPEDGGIFKQYLIERAKQKEGNASSGSVLLGILEKLKNEYPNQDPTYIKIKANIICEYNIEFESKMFAEVLHELEWPAVSFEIFLAKCINNGLLCDVEERLKEVAICIKNTSPIYYAVHMSSILKAIGKSLAILSDKESILFFERAYEINQTPTNGLTLLKCYKDAKNYDAARILLNQLSQKNPESKGIRKELESKWYCGK